MRFPSFGKTFENLQEETFTNFDNEISQRNKETIMSSIAMKPNNSKEFFHNQNNNYYWTIK